MEFFLQKVKSGELIDTFSCFFQSNEIMIACMEAVWAVWQVSKTSFNKENLFIDGPQAAHFETLERVLPIYKDIF
jgi:hypothetical protein